MEYRILLLKDIVLSNIRYSPLKRSSNKNRYSLISYFNQDKELQSFVFQCKQMNVYELSVNDRQQYSIVFELNSNLMQFITTLERKIQDDLVHFRSKQKDDAKSEPVDGRSMTNGTESVVDREHQDSIALSPQNTASQSSSLMREPWTDKSSSPSFGAERDSKSNVVAIGSKGNDISEGKDERKTVETKRNDEHQALVAQNMSQKTIMLPKTHNYKFRSSITRESNTALFKSRIGRLSNLVVFDQYRKLYEDEKDIIRMLKNPSVMVVPIIECVGLWITNDNEYGLSWVCHHVKVIQSCLLFKKYLFVSDESDQQDNLDDKENDYDYDDDNDEQRHSQVERQQNSLPAK